MLPDSGNSSSILRVESLYACISSSTLTGVPLIVRFLEKYARIQGIFRLIVHRNERLFDNFGDPFYF